MSYTMLDWLYDISGRMEDAPRLNRPHQSCTDLIVQVMREEGRVVVRRSDIEALVQFARDEGIDPENEDQWNEDEVMDSVLMAVANWAKEHRDWEKE